ncbi:MAG: hypothetical protein ABIQ58_03070 [Candidatus Limnocylindrales bacterium]
MTDQPIDKSAATPAGAKVTRARATTVGPATPASRATNKAARAAKAATTTADRQPEPSAPPVALEPTTVAGNRGAIPVMVDATSPGLPVAGALRDLTISQGGLTTASAERIQISQGGISQARATSIDVTRGGIANAQATDIAVSQGGIAIARADRISVEMGGVAIAVAREARVSQGFVRNLLARDATFEQGAVGSIAANHVTVNGPSVVGFVLARHVHGEVRTLFDWRGALAFGAVAGLLIGLFRRR